MVRCEVRGVANLVYDLVMWVLAAQGAVGDVNGV
jgi:hypothetical protein